MNCKVPQWQRLAALLIAAFLLLFLVIPVVQVIFVAFQSPATGAFTLVNFQDFFNTSLFREAFWNSLYVAVMSVLVATVFTLYVVPVAYQLLARRTGSPGAVRQRLEAEMAAGEAND